MIQYRNSELPQNEIITKLRKYYKSNDLYRRHYIHEEEDTSYHHQWYSRIKPLRNVVPRAVDFFALKMLPSDVNIITPNSSLKEAIDLILKWSNFNEKKKLYLTDLSLTGDLFLKVNVTNNKVYFQYIQPEDVVAINEDYRGYLQDIRIEYEVEDENGNLLTYTEYWNKEYFAIWETSSGRNLSLEQLGTPKTYGMLSEFGLDFCPFIHIKFKDIGKINNRGTGCVEQSLDIIDEANRQATIQGRDAFRNKQTWVLSADTVDANNFTLDPIKQIKRVYVASATPTESEQNITTPSEDIWQAPAMSKLTSLLSGIDWGGLDVVVKSTMEELRQQIPALKYYDVAESNISERTLSLLLDAALSQAKESGKNFINGIIRACQIGLTLGIFSGLFPSSLGTYQLGNFDFTIDAGDAFSMRIDDKILILSGLKANGIELKVAMKMAGFSEDEISKVAEVTPILPIIPNNEGG